MPTSLSQYRLITGIRSYRPNPIIISQCHETIQAAPPVTDKNSFQAEDFDKDYAFNYTQQRLFQRHLYLGEQILLTADQLKMISDEVHGMGRLRERGLTLLANAQQTTRITPQNR
jgi:hypothetical protein